MAQKYYVKKMIGEKYGYWEIIGVSDQKYSAKCKCVCGKIKDIRLSSLVSGDSSSCGCMTKEVRIKAGKNLSDFRKKATIDGSNLYQVQSRLNGTLNKNNHSGVNGVCKLQNGKYNAHITFKGKRYHIGNFDNLDDAKTAREMADKMIEEFYNENKEGIPSLKDIRKDISKNIKNKKRAVAMDKFVITCTGEKEKIVETFDPQESIGLDFLWGKDIEVTWSYVEETDENTSKIIAYGFAPSDNMVEQLIKGNARKEFAKVLKQVGVVLNRITYYSVDGNEWLEERHRIENIH